MFRGVIRELNFEKYRNITPEEAHRYDSPELSAIGIFPIYPPWKRMAARSGSMIQFREEGLISYPPWYPSVTVSTGKAGS